MGSRAKSVIFMASRADESSPSARVVPMELKEILISMMTGFRLPVKSLSFPDFVKATACITTKGLFEYILAARQGSHGLGFLNCNHFCDSWFGCGTLAQPFTKARCRQIGTG